MELAYLCQDQPTQGFSTQMSQELCSSGGDDSKPIPNIFFQDRVRRNDKKTDVCSSLQISVINLELLVLELIMSEVAWSRLGSRAATAGKAPKAWALPRFWVSIRSYEITGQKKLGQNIGPCLAQIRCGVPAYQCFTTFLVRQQKPHSQIICETILPLVLPSNPKSHSLMQFLQMHQSEQ